MWFRNGENPFPHARMLTSASQDELDRDARRELEYLLTTVARQVSTALTVLGRPGRVTRGSMFARIDVMISDLERAARRLMAAEQEARKARERAERKSDRKGML